jgi:hypothetical protein
VASGDPAADGGGRAGPPRWYTLTEADIDVVNIEIRIGRRSRLAASGSPLTSPEHADYSDFVDCDPPPTTSDINDYRVDNDHYDGDALSHM